MVNPDLLNPQELLANDPETVRAYEGFIASKLRQFIDDPSRIRELTQSAMRRLIAGLREGDTPTPAQGWVIGRKARSSCSSSKSSSR